LIKRGYPRLIPVQVGRMGDTKSSREDDRPTDMSALPGDAGGGPSGGGLVGYQPLYRQVKAEFVRRIADGRWSPGDMLPSEMHLSADLGVSQGTVRKALDELAAENLVVRQQGRGTFVGRYDEARILFQFFRLKRDDGARLFPESRILDSMRDIARKADVAALGLAIGDPVFRIRRLRSLEAAPVLVETIVVPLKLFKGIESLDLPNNLYGLYADRFGVTVTVSAEKLKAIAAPASTAQVLGLKAGEPLLEVDRVAESIDGQPAEWRVSHCRTDRYHYWART
jgi:GntR family transcriptional regulator